MTRLDPPRQINHSRPQFLPDGRHFLCYANGNSEGRGVCVGSLDSPDSTRLFDAPGPSGIHAAGPPRFRFRDRPCSSGISIPPRVKVHGDPVLVAQDVVSVTASSTGIVAYRSRPPGQPQPPHVEWFDRTGKVTPRLSGTELGFGLSPELSPDGSRLAVFATSTPISISGCSTSKAVGRRASHRIRQSKASQPGHRTVRACSLRRTWAGNSTGSWRGGTGTEHAIWKAPDVMAPMDWSRNGFMLFQQGLVFKRDLYALRLSNDAKVDGEPVPIAVDPNFDERDGKFSPDGRWIVTSRTKRDASKSTSFRFPRWTARFR